jgi:hypothetical protein
VKFVFDTNILVSAILKPESVPTLALQMALKKGVIVFSDETRSELLEVLSRSKFDKYIVASDRLAKVALIEHEIVSLTETTEQIACRDDEDIPFLKIVLQHPVSCIVTGDQDLLVLHPFRNVPILKPSDFINQYEHV